MFFWNPADLLLLLVFISVLLSYLYIIFYICYFIGNFLKRKPFTLLFLLFFFFSVLQCRSIEKNCSLIYFSASLMNLVNFKKMNKERTVLLMRGTDYQKTIFNFNDCIMYCKSQVISPAFYLGIFISLFVQILRLPHLFALP